MSDSTPHFRYITHKYGTGRVKGEDRTVDPYYCAGGTSPVCTHIGPVLPGNSGTLRPEISHSCLEMVEWKEETGLSPAYSEVFQPLPSLMVTHSFQMSCVSYKGLISFRCVC